MKRKTTAARPPVVLTIAGFDPGSGAGITADLKTFAAHGCYGVACITALTVQSTRGVRRVDPLPPKLVSETLAELASDFEIAAVKIGMLGSGGVARAVLEFLRRRKFPQVVLDPVLRSSSGAALLERSAIPLLRRFLPLVQVITPNAGEAALLSGISIKTAGRIPAAAARLHQLGSAAVVITGGDFPARSRTAVDYFSADFGADLSALRGRRIPSRNTHGTGCAFSSAIAANLAWGKTLPEAVLAAKRYVERAIAAAPQLGHGRGPLNHLVENS